MSLRHVLNHFMELPKVTISDKEGHTDVMRQNGPGWMVTSGNISTGSGIGKFPLDPFHHQRPLPHFTE